MASSINVVAISGNMTREPELKQLPSGTTVANFGLAVTENRRQPDNTWKDVVSFIDCVAFNAQAKTIAKFGKGYLVSVSGRLQQRRWQGQDGTNQSKVEVICESVIGDSMFNDAAGNPPANRPQSQPRQATQPTQAGQSQPASAPPASQPAQPTGEPAPVGADAYGMDDDIPF